MEEVNEARGEPVWYQLYATSNWSVTEAVVRRVRAAGCPVVVLTVDLPVGSNRLTLRRWSRTDERTCVGCHRPRGRAPTVKPMFQGTDYAPEDFRAPGMTWDFIGPAAGNHRSEDRGQGTRDARGRAARAGARRGRHLGVEPRRAVRGERAGDHRRPAGDRRRRERAGPGDRGRWLPPGQRHLQGGSRGGADAVAVGRPYLWGLGAFGQPGVERVLEILRDELAVTMRLAGAPSLASIGTSSIGSGG